MRRVELTHDVLCGVVKASRELRLEREAKEEAERQLAAQAAREEATRKALVRARQVAAVCGVLAVGRRGGAIFGYVNMPRARGGVGALETRKLAEGARGEAEKLVVYLLEDFQLELEPIGRLDVVANLSKRALDYYAGLPGRCATRPPSATGRWPRCATARRSGTGRPRGRTGPLEDAEAVFNRLRAQGDSRKCWWSGWPPHCSCVPRSSVPRKCFRRPSQPGMPASRC